MTPKEERKCCEKCYRHVPGAEAYFCGMRDECECHKALSQEKKDIELKDTKCDRGTCGCIDGSGCGRDTGCRCCCHYGKKEGCDCPKPAATRERKEAPNTITEIERIVGRFVMDYMDMPENYERVLSSAIADWLRITLTTFQETIREERDREILAAFEEHFTRHKKMASDMTGFAREGYVLALEHMEEIASHLLTHTPKDSAGTPAPNKHRDEQRENI